MHSEFLIRAAGTIQYTAFTALLVFPPLAWGAKDGWAFYISLWLALLALTAMILKRLWQGKSLVPRSSLDFPLALLLIIAAGSWFISIYREATFWALLRLVLYIVAFYLAFETTASRSQTKRLLITLLGMGTLISIIGFIKYVGGPIPSFWDYSTVAEKGRLNSTFVNANHFAGYLEMVFFLGLGFVFSRTTRKVFVWSLCLFLISVALLFTMSRGGWIATFGSLLVMGVFLLLQKGVSKVKICFTASALLLIWVLLFLGSNPMTERIVSLQDPKKRHLDYGRLPAWQGSVQLIREYPLQGTGLGTFPWSFASVRPAGMTLRWREAHNDYLQIVTEMGLPVLIPVMLGLFLVFRGGLKTFRETQSRLRAGVTLGALGGIVAILIHSLFDFNIQITSNGILFSVLIGLIMGSTTSTKTQSPI